MTRPSVLIEGSKSDNLKGTTAAQTISPCVSGIRLNEYQHGYVQNRFEGKLEQMHQVFDYIKEKGFIPMELVENEVAWFYSNLGIDDMYFMVETVEIIAKHIMALYAAKITAYIKNEAALDIDLQREDEDGAVYIHTSRQGDSEFGVHVEKRLDEKYFNVSSRERSYRLESFRSTGNISSSSISQLRCYFVKQCSFVDPEISVAETDIKKVSDISFLNKATSATLESYQKIIISVLSRTGPVIELFDIEGSRMKKIVIGYRQRSTLNFFSALTDLYHYYELYFTRKYVEHFANGVTIISLYLCQIADSHAPPIEHSIVQTIKEISLIYCLPTTPFQSLFQSTKLSVQESIYGYVGLVFAQHFLNRLGSEYASLLSTLDKFNPVHMEILTKMKKRLRQDTFTREYVLDIVKSYPSLIKALYVNFAMSHYVGGGTDSDSVQPTLSFQRLQTDRVWSEEEILQLIKKTVSNDHKCKVFESFLTFNQHVLKTNFYMSTKNALAFRLDPSFLPETEYPTRPYGLFLVLGSEFRGFHLRFRDVARGGIRIIKSRNREAFSINFRSLFDETYALAATQQRKNKDIPEGGSKGTILLNADQQDKAYVSFQKYVDSILDLLVTGDKSNSIVDKYGQNEILFFGPDEGTAEFMDWASQHAKLRGASFWKAFTTGKSQSLGGIPHDLFGMTTRSVRQYVAGIYRKLGLKEESVTKFQTGGPDGDLGSNEIKLSKEKTVAVVDGSGVIFDPDGIDGEELERLACARKTISSFDVKKLGSRGGVVLIEDHDVRLPDGRMMEDGLRFRNEFHLGDLSTADIFVPCGGRPESVDIGNVSQLLDSDGVCRFKYVVEGANLFFTQEARLVLERAGCIIFKDASANKGGVTSSSMEVLAALALSDEEFETNMQVGDTVPAFYRDYVKCVHSIIERNAELEFEAIWREHKRTGIPRCSVSDELSFAIMKLDEELQQAMLWQNIDLRKVILGEALPKLLQEKVGLDVLVERIPEPYLRALFGSYLASRFVYQYGISPSQFAFFEFMERYYDKASFSK